MPGAPLALNACLAVSMEDVASVTPRTFPFDGGCALPPAIETALCDSRVYALRLVDTLVGCTDASVGVCLGRVRKPGTRKVRLPILCRRGAFLIEPCFISSSICVHQMIRLPI